MAFRFTCECPEREVSMGLDCAWECWRIGKDGEIAELVESGNDG